MISALDLAPGYRAATRHVHQVADHRTSGAVQTVARNCHRRELLPSIRLRIVGFIGAEHLPGSFASEYYDPAVDVDA